MKNIVVVGAGKGIGLKTTEMLASDNRVLAFSRSESPALDHLPCEFQKFNSVEDDVEDMNLPEAVHGLVYCPGSINLKPFHRLSEEHFLEDFRQNVIGALRVIQHALPSLKKEGGSVVLFSTVAARQEMPFHASIATAKAALEGLAVSLAAEYAAQGVRVNVIAPSLTRTSLSERLLSTEAKEEAAAQRHPIHRVGEPEDMASMVKFLLSDESSWITGQIIGIDGGMGALRI